MAKRRPNVRRATVALVEASHAMLNAANPRDAAAISYFSLFALFPAMLVLIALVDAFLGWIDLHDTVVQRILALFPGSRALLAQNLAEITDLSPAVVLSCILVVIWSSTWLFTFIENALNLAWGVERRRTFWESRVRSIGLLVIAGFFLLASAGITIVVGAARSRSTVHISRTVIDWFWSSILLAAGFVVAVMVFTLIFKLMPDRKVLWLEAVSGGFVSALLWDAGSYIFAKLVPYFDYQRVYGRTGAIIALLTWVYTSNLIMLYGANFSAKLHRPSPDETGSRPELPADGAAPERRIRQFRRPNG